MGLNGISETARTLSYFVKRQDATATNLAQASTHAFKAERLAAHAAGPDGAPEAVAWRDWSQGSLRRTDRPLDVALEGPGFLVVQTPDGDMLSRGGPLEVDPRGRITQGGHLVLGQEGPITADGVSLTIDGSGLVFVDGEANARLRLVTVPEPQNLQRTAGGLFAVPEDVAPAADGSVQVRQGFLEEANVDPILSMVDMITVQRSYAANIQVLKVMDRVLGVAATQVGGD